MKTIGEREMSAEEERLVKTIQEFYKNGMSVSEIIQAAYEAQFLTKREMGRPVQANIKETHQR